MKETQAGTSCVQSPILHNQSLEQKMQRPLIKPLLTFIATIVAASATFAQGNSVATTSDVVVYGGTSGGVIAAVQAKRMGHSVVIVCPDKHLGGLSSGGLGWTDTGNKSVIGGLARDFYHRVWKHYQTDDAWKWQKRSEYGNKGQGAAAIDGELRTMWIFEPHVAENVFDELVKEYEIPVFRNEWLDRENGVSKSNGRISSISMLSGRSCNGRMFIDATYEGDLLATAEVDYHVGRESRAQYGEDWNGIQTGVLHHGHHFGVLKKPISPYVVPGDPSSGLLPRISAEPPGNFGDADKRVQAYCFRMCLTNDPKNRVPFPKPEGYDANQYELLVRVLEAGWREGFNKFDPIPRPFQHRQHRLQLRLPGSIVRAPSGNYQRARGLPAGPDALPGEQPARPGRRSKKVCTMGTRQRRIHRQRQLASSNLRSRSASNGWQICHDRKRTAQEKADARVNRNGFVHDGFSQRPALRHSGRLRSE
jgi:hypothetical protein